METIFKRDYKIEITFDINGTPTWSLCYKGKAIVANKEQEQLVTDTLGELKEKMERCTY